MLAGEVDQVAAEAHRGLTSTAWTARRTAALLNRGQQPSCFHPHLPEPQPAQPGSLCPWEEAQPSVRDNSVFIPNERG
jgi:hypothetical protein